MIEEASYDPVQKFKDWEYNEFLCYRDFGELLKEARREVVENMLSNEDKEQIEKYEFGDVDDDD